MEQKLIELGDIIAESLNHISMVKVDSYPQFLHVEMFAKDNAFYRELKIQPSKPNSKNIFYVSYPVYECDVLLCEIDIRNKSKEEIQEIFITAFHKQMNAWIEEESTLLKAMKSFIRKK